MPRILVGRSTLEASAEYVFRNADERCERSVVQRVRKRVVRVEVEVLPGRLIHLQGSAVIHGVAGQIVTTDQTRWITRNAAVIVLSGRPAWRRRGSWVALIGSGGNALNRTQVAQ